MYTQIKPELPFDKCHIIKINLLHKLALNKTYLILNDIHLWSDTSNGKDTILKMIYIFLNYVIAQMDFISCINVDRWLSCWNGIMSCKVATRFVDNYWIAVKFKNRTFEF